MPTTTKILKDQYEALKSGDLAGYRLSNLKLYEFSPLDGFVGMRNVRLRSVGGLHFVIADNKL